MLCSRMKKENSSFPLLVSTSLPKKMKEFIILVVFSLFLSGRIIFSHILLCKFPDKTDEKENLAVGMGVMSW